MKFSTSPALMFSLLLSACATESITGQDTRAGHQHPAEQTKACATADVSSAISCSETVSASFDKQGKLWVAWVYQGHIYVQHSADKGGHFSEAVAVNTEAEAVTAHDEYRPKIQLDAQGGVYLSWTLNLGNMRSGHIRFSRSTDGGKSFSKPVTVNDNMDIIGHRFDSLAIGQNGEIYIAWLDARDKEQAKAANRDFDGSSLYYAWSDNGGISFHPNKIAAPHSCECCRLSTQIDRDNLPIILWRQVFEGNIRDHALLKFKDWNTPGDIRRVSRENWKIDACPHHGASLSIADGVYHAAWFSGAADHQGLFYSNSADGGLSFSPPYPFGGKGAGHPSIQALGQKVTLAWSRFDGENNLLEFIRSTDAGKTWSPPRQIGKTGSAADQAFVLSDDRTQYVSWQTKEGYRLMPIEE